MYFNYKTLIESNSICFVIISIFNWISKFTVLLENTLQVPAVFIWVPPLAVSRLINNYICQENQWLKNEKKIKENRYLERWLWLITLMYIQASKQQSKSNYSPLIFLEFGCKNSYFPGPHLRQSWWLAKAYLRQGFRH